MRRAIRAGAGLLGGLVLAWAAGFAWFVYDTRIPVPFAANVRADGIVALTGGADRVPMALRLLNGGCAPLLLVSGVGRGAALGALDHDNALAAEQEAELVASGRVTLGRAATSTVGNAAETASWARAHDIRSLLVVTAGYHMPRALLELERTLPDVALIPVPVQPPALRRLQDPAVWRLLAGEYSKWLAVRSGVAPWLRWRDGSRREMA